MIKAPKPPKAGSSKDPSSFIPYRPNYLCAISPHWTLRVGFEVQADMVPYETVGQAGAWGILASLEPWKRACGVGGRPCPVI